MIDSAVGMSNDQAKCELATVLARFWLLPVQVRIQGELVVKGVTTNYGCN
jgi:hypothetical protein